MNIDTYRDGLSPYLPEGTSDIVAKWLMDLELKVVLWNNRRTKLGDFRVRPNERYHSISVNKSLNRYAFLITIVHEIAHAAVHKYYGRRVLPHGQEWKNEYQKRLHIFLENQTFPPDLESVISNHLKNPKASASADVSLEKALRRYDSKPSDIVFVDELKVNDIFVTSDGKVFKKGEKRRSRHHCEEIKTGRKYLISGLAEVKLYQNQSKKQVEIQETRIVLGDLKIGDRFFLSNGMHFVKGETKRTRTICTEIKTQKLYSIPESMEVIPQK